MHQALKGGRSSGESSEDADVVSVLRNMSVMTIVALPVGVGFVVGSDVSGLLQGIGVALITFGVLLAAATALGIVATALHRSNRESA